ncbi:hypothetical protein GOODEAATRI_001113 [Goodea atripinnis]|uniref:Uncharacterized protein n=1 Tax=Goodea atripinnis TaxID=208336 RepID=A0ABV0PAJ1_9TELE
MDVVHSLALAIRTLNSQVQVPIPQRGDQPLDPGGGPLHSGVERGRPPQHQPTLVPAPSKPEQPMHRPQPIMTPIPIWGEGAMNKRGVYLANQSRPRRKQSQPPNEF